MDETLAVGAFGEGTKTLHRILEAQGHALPADEVQRGFFGPATQAALLEAQAAMGRPTTGVVAADALAAWADQVFPSTAGSPFKTADTPVSANLGAAIAAAASIKPANEPIVAGGSPTVSGVLALDHGAPADGLTIKAFKTGPFGKRTLLGQAVTDAQGTYTLSLSPPGQSRVQLVGVAPDGTEHPLTQAYYLDPAQTRADLVAPGYWQPLAPEFERLTSAVAPHLGGDLAKLSAAQQFGPRRDFSDLSDASGWDAAALALAAEAYTNTTETHIPIDGHYAMARAGLPTDVTTLARIDTQSVVSALKKAADAGIITQATVDQSVNAFNAFKMDFRSSHPIEGALSSPNAFLNLNVVMDNDLSLFTEVARQNPGPGIWDRATAAGVSDQGLARLRLQGKLAYLTFNNAGLTGRLMAIIDQDVKELITLGFHATEKWREEVDNLAQEGDAAITDAVPPVFHRQGTDGGVMAYCAELARRVRQMDPHAVTVNRVTTSGIGGIDPQGPVATLLTNASSAGFRLGSTPLTPFLAKNAETIWKGVDTPLRDEAIAGLRKLSVLYAVSPNDETLDALSRAGLTSATQIAALDRSSLQAKLQLNVPDIDLNPQVLTELTWRARQYSATVFNIFDGLKRLPAVPYPPGSSPEDVRKRDDQVIKTRAKLTGLFPTLETLFGSVDYCECEHCRSVLSPAAYLVDLLRFIDPPEVAWETIKASYQQRTNEPYGKSKPFDVLDKRRPDIKNIALTCENTNVALPYIDVVNEVLEQVMMSSQGPVRIQAYDVGDASSQDLIAEPENILWSAYVGTSATPGLRDLRYPPGLPFDLPLEVVRAFLDRLDLPLWRLRQLLARPIELAGGASALSDGWVDVWYERLGMSDSEVDSVADAEQWFRLFGYESVEEALRKDAAADGSRPSMSSLCNAKNLARRLGVTYEELVELLRTRLVNPNIEALLVLHRLGVDPVMLDRTFGYGTPLSTEEKAQFEKHVQDLGYQITDLQGLRTSQIRQSTLVLEAPSADCDFSQMFLAFSESPPDPDAALSMALLKLNLLVRLHRKLGWHIHDVDRAVLALMPGVDALTAATWEAVTRTLLIYLAHTTEVAARLGDRVSVEDVLTLWSDVPAVGISPLYERLFLTHAVLGQDLAFAKRLGRVLSDPAVPLAGHIDGVRQALGLSHDEIEAVLTAAQASDRDLTLGNLSILLRHVVLARGLDLPLADLLTLLNLSTRHPFTPIDGSPLTSVADDNPWTETLALLDDVDRMRDAGVDVDFVDRVCRRGTAVREPPPAENDPVQIAVDSLPGPPTVDPDRRKVLLSRTLAAQLSTSVAVIDVLIGEVLTDASGQPLADSGFSDPVTTTQSLTRLRQALYVVQTVDLAEGEIRYLHRRSGVLDLNDLPISEVNPSAGRDNLRVLTRWLQLAALHKRYPNRARLLAVLNTARQPIDTENTAAARSDQFRTALAALTGLDAAWLEAALDAIGVNPVNGTVFEVPAFADPAQLHHSIEALRALIRVRLDPRDTVAFATSKVTDEVARKVRASLKGRYSPGAWRKLIQPAYDRIRRLQRDALVAHLTSIMDEGRPKYGDTTEKLFEFLLLDPGTEPVVLASRIQLAISTVQLFIQRCLMNLEEGVDPQIIDAERWEWMCRYRVWEANRKIFLWAANWVAPELRDDKTHLFRNLESKLFQGDVNEDLVRDSLYTYVKGLEEIARLQLLSMYFEPGVSADASTIHVVGRTPHTPHKYFHRTATHGMWTPWAPIDIGIEGEHLILTAWRGRMHLFWVSFLEQGAEKPGGLGVIHPGAGEIPLETMRGTTHISIQLHWAEQIKGEWKHRNSTPYVDAPFAGSHATTDEQKRKFFVRAVVLDNGPGQQDDDLEIHVSRGEVGHKFVFFSKLAPPTSGATSGNDAPKPPPFALNQGSAAATKWSSAAGPLQVSFTSAVTERTDTPTQLQGGLHSILNSNQAFTLLFPGNDIRPPQLRRPPSGTGRPSGYVSMDQNAQHVAYRASDGNIYDLYRSGVGWFYQSPTAEAQLPGTQHICPPAASDPHGYSADGQHMICIAYSSGDAVHELVWSLPNQSPGDPAQADAMWRLDTAYQATAEDQRVGRPLGGIFAPTRGIVFRTPGGRLRASFPTELGTWETQVLNEDLPLALSEPTGTVMRRTEGAAAPVTSRHVFYVGNDNDIHELRTDAAGQSWTHTNITAGIPEAVKPKADTTPAAYSFRNQNTVHVVYRGTDDRIHELWGSPGSWNHIAIGATSTKAGGDPAGYVTEWVNIQHVVYRGEHNEVVELWWSATSQWQENILSETVPGVSRAGTGEIAGYSFETDHTQHVAYLDENGAPRELCWDGVWHAGWYELDNPFPDDLGPLSSPFFYESSSADHTFFVEPYVVETAVHEWSEWVVTTKEYVWPTITVLPLNPTRVNVQLSPVALNTVPAFVNSILPAHAALVTSKGVLVGSPIKVSLGSEVASPGVAQATIPRILELGRQGLAGNPTIGIHLRTWST